MKLIDKIEDFLGEGISAALKKDQKAKERIFKKS